MWRPTSPADPAARTARFVTVAATVVFALIVCRFQPWHLFVRETYSNDFYDEQARSFLRLQLAVRPEIPGQEGFVIDGSTYLYYGPFLALVRMPFALFGDLFSGRLARLSMIVAFVVFCTGCFHLLRVVATRWGGATSPWRAGTFVAAAACSPVLFLSGWVSVYHETELWAAAFAVWSFVSVLRLIEVPSPTRRQMLGLGGLLVAGILTRASVGLGVAAGVCLAVLVASRPLRTPASGTTTSGTTASGTTASDTPRPTWRTPTRRRLIATVFGASASGFVIHAAINWAKFGSPTKLPGQLQLLSLNDHARAAWFAGNNDSFFSLGFLETTVVHYLRPDTVRIERLFPFIRYGPLATDRGSYPMETITPSASLTTAATLLVAAALVGIVLVVRARAWTLLALTFGGAVAAAPTFTIGFIGNRYLVDMLPMLLAPAALAFVTLSISSFQWRRGVRIAVVGLVAWGAWCNVSLALWTQQLKEPGFTESRYRVDGWVFGDPAPALVDLVIGAPVPRDGTVALDRDPSIDRCSAVYIAEQGGWVALERSNDGRRLAGTVTLDGERTLVAGGDNWRITAIATTTSGTATSATATPDNGAPDEVRLEATVTPDDDGAGGASATSESIAVADDGTLVVDVVADPVMGQLWATVGGEPAVFVFAAPSGGAIPGRTVVVDDHPGDSLCRQLEARR